MATTPCKGGRPRTGSIVWRFGKKAGKPHWHVRLTLDDGRRSPPVALDPSIPREDVAGAKAAAKILAAEAAASGVTSAMVRETVEEYAGRWLAERDGRVNSIRDDRGRMRVHVLPAIGALDARTFGRDDLERLRDHLDDQILSGGLSWKTAANVWTLVTKLCDDMVSSKKRALRIRDDNPCRDVRAPDRGARKAKQYLFPSEFLQFVSSPRVPLRWRRAVALAVYTYARDGELRALRFDEGDVDLEHGVLSITRAWNRNANAIRPTKTGHTRRFALETTVLPLLNAIAHERTRKGPVTISPSDHDLARNLRRWLRRAGVNRPELHEGSPTRKPLTWHDLRATGITWMAVRGDDPLKIKQRAGHTIFQTTEHYIREAEAVRVGFGDVFPPLPDCLLGPPGVSDRVSVLARPETRNALFSRAAQCEGRDLNPGSEPPSHPEKDAGSSPPTSTTHSERVRESEPIADPPRPSVTGVAEPPTLDVLRRKLDAAIVAEAWDAVKAIRERIADVERAAAGNVVPIGAGRRVGGAS